MKRSAQAPNQDEFFSRAKVIAEEPCLQALHR